VQVPVVVASAHERQVPVQAVVQQVPCSQNPELHSLAAAHGALTGFLPQLPLTQLLGGLQSPFVVHDVRQAPLVPHTYGSQVVGVAAWLPVPLQVRPRERHPTQVAPAHPVPEA
jgi:hypothetical protein